MAQIALKSIHLNTYLFFKEKLIMAMLHFFGGEKGGAGKSFVARTAVQYHLDRKMDFALFDADRYNPDLKRIYQSAGCREIIFSESKKHEDKAKAPYLSAMKKTTLVNLPAQILNPFKDWFEKNRLFNMAQRDGVEFTIWSVCSGGHDSLNLFGKYLAYFQGRVNYVLVKNWGLCEEWETLENDKFLQRKIEEYGVKVLDFPEFMGADCRNRIDQKSLTFGAAREYKDFDLFDRQRVKTFLEEASTAFDNAGVFYEEVNVKKVENVESASKTREEVKTTEPVEVPEPVKKQNKVKIATSNGQVDHPFEPLSELA